LKGLCPCPICHVPIEKQSDLTSIYPLRTATETQKFLKHADSLEYGYEKNEFLKNKGLHYIKVILYPQFRTPANSQIFLQNSFWHMHNSDVHKALSFDRLHFLGGLWEHHLWSEVKFRVDNLPKSAATRVDKQ
jgi:hypothetical protein